MKKAISLIMAFVLCLGLCACVDTEAHKLKTAKENANALVSQWNEAAEQGCIYSVVEGENETEYYVVATIATDLAYNNPYSTLMIAQIARGIKDELYPKLNDVFVGTNMSVIILVKDLYSNEIFYEISDGQLIDYD